MYAIRSYYACGSHPGSPCDQHGHAELPGDPFDAAAELSVADDAECHAGQLSDRIAEKAEIVRLLPLTVANGLRKTADVVREIEEYAEDMLYRNNFV